MRHYAKRSAPLDGDILKKLMLLSSSWFFDARVNKIHFEFFIYEAMPPEKEGGARKNREKIYG